MVLTKGVNLHGQYIAKVLPSIHHSSSRLTDNPHQGGAAKRARLLYFGMFKEKAMTLIIITLTAIFVLGGIGPLLVTEGLQDEMVVGH